MKTFFRQWSCGLMLTGAIGAKLFAGEETNAPAPVTARDFYNAGTRLLAATNFAGAETMFESALAAQDERVQPPALYNLGHTRFGQGGELLKKGPDAQKVSARGNAALAGGAQAVHAVEAALTETNLDRNLDRMVAAYLEGRGARHELRAAEKAVQTAMETYGKTLLKWQRAADDFKSAAELNSADTNATHNAEIVERELAKLIDQLSRMQAMDGAMGKQRADLGKLLSQLRGQIPAPNAPPGGPGDEEDEDSPQPDSLAGQKENGPREGDQMQVPLSPETAGQILDGLSLDGTRRLAMSDQEGKPAAERKGRNW